MPGIAEWTTAEWQDLVTDWVDERLAATGAARTGSVVQTRVRAWGTVLTAPTTTGRVWIKAPSRAAAAEVGLYELLARAAQEWTLPPLAVDLERGWVLLPDGGTPLGERPGGDAAFVDVLPRYAQLQRALAPHVPEMLALGIPDMRAAVLPQRFDETLDAVRRAVWFGDATDRATLRRVAVLRPRIEEWAARLTEAAAPASIDHNDLHPRNVLADGSGRERFFDWGESVVAHPFASMLVALSHIARRTDEATTARARDAYLEVFTDLAPRTQLREELDAVCHSAIAPRALIWQRALGAEAVEERFARAPFEILRLLLDDSWSGAY
jgi:hypothetical protein